MSDAEFTGDELVEYWDRYVSEGRRPRPSNHDQEVIAMLHTRAWSPVPRAAFTAGLRVRLAGATRPTSQDSVLAPAFTEPARPPVPAGLSHRRPHRHWGDRLNLLGLAAATIVVALLASLGGRLAHEPAAPTIQAPLFVSSPNPVASPFGPTGGCPDLGAAQTHVASAFVDSTLMTEIAAVLPSVRHATLQRLTRSGAGSVLPERYDLSGVSGVVVDAVVLGAATATFREGAWITAVDSMRFTGMRPVFPDETVDLVRGDVVVYPIGTLLELSNALDGRNVEIARLTLHDVEELPGRATDSITVMTLARTDLDITRLTRSPIGFTVSIGYSVGLLSAAVPGADCPPETGVLISGIDHETPIGGDPDARPRYGGPLVWLLPLSLYPPGGGPTGTPSR